MSIIKQLKGLCRQFIVIMAVVITLGFVNSPAQATLLNLTQQNPDITTWFIDVDYNVSENVGTLYATTNDLGYSFTDTGVTRNPSSFELTATIDILTGSLLSGQISIDDLIAGSLTQFGYGAAGGILEFLFTPNSGSLKNQYGSVGGIILGGSDFSGNLAQEFANDGFGSADTFLVAAPVPEPSTAALLLLGGAGMFFARRRMTAKR